MKWWRKDVTEDSSRIHNAVLASLSLNSLRVPSAQYRAEVRGFESVLYGMHEKAGGQVVVATQEQRDAWRKVVEPIYPQIVDETGGQSKAFFAQMEAGRKACAK